MHYIYKCTSHSLTQAPGGSTDHVKPPLSFLYTMLTRRRFPSIYRDQGYRFVIFYSDHLFYVLVAGPEAEKMVFFILEQ